MRGRRSFVLILGWILMCPSFLYAQRGPSNWGDSWNNYEVISTEGNEFWVTLMLNSGVQPNDDNLRLQLIGAARQQTEVELTYGDGGIETFTIPAGNTYAYTIQKANAIYCSEQTQIFTKRSH